MVPIRELQKMITAEIRSQSEILTGREPKELYAPVEYSLGMGGKRLRPVLLLMAFNMFSDEIEKALPAAVAVEVFHNFTLLHDDIMDRAQMRRNKPTVHKQFNINNAILSGDAMAFLSYRYLMKCRSKQLSGIISLFTETALEVCEGQQYDMDFEKRQDVTEAEYLEMIRLKTAVLLGCSLKAGAMLANSTKQKARQLYEFGINLGLAFQLQDDLLDTFGNQETFGKKIGGDIVANKKTYLLIKALEKASPGQRKELTDWITQKEFKPAEKIIAVSDLYNELEIKKLTEQKIDSYFNVASQLLNLFPLEKAIKKPLKELSERMLKRNN
jgi:geranylgeranyl diphosphate synthase, type II